MNYRSAYDPALSPRDWAPYVAWSLLLAVLVVTGFLFHREEGLRQQLRGHDAQLTNLNSRDRELLRRLDATEEQNQLLRAQLEIAGEKLGMTQRDLAQTRASAETLRRGQKQTVAQIGMMGKEVTTLRSESGKLTGDMTAAKGDIADTRKSLEETRIQLVSAVGDLSNTKTLIARNHDELQELRRRGERNYFEFDLGKDKQPSRIGDVSLRLKKADPKNQRYNLEVVADDLKTEKKDRNANEPVQFYKGDKRGLYEIVVNRISKDRVTGYLATPK